MLLLSILAVAVAVAYLGGTRSARRAEREWTTSHRFDASGVLAGASSITIQRGPRAVLLLHGAGDTPQSLAFLASRLAARNYTVHAPLLSGHGRTLADFAHSTAGDWLASARAGYESIRRGHEWVGIIGQSMGGALAVQLAAEHPELPALGLAAPYLGMPASLVWAARLAPVWGVLHPYATSNDDRSIHDPVERARGLGYDRFAAHALIALRHTMEAAAAELPRVAAPTLLVQSEEDNRVAASVAERAFTALAARTKKLVWVNGCGHVLTVDYCRERVADLFCDWMDAERGVSS